MPIRKGYCFKCKNATEAERVFEVSIDSKNCYCPRCLSQFDPAEVTVAYSKVLDEKIKIASRKFLVDYDFYAAYKGFASVIEIDKDYVPAHLWRIISLCCLSTLRRATFIEAKEIFNAELPLYENYEDNEVLLTFVIRLINTCAFYLYRFRRRTSIKNSFFEVECIALFYQRINCIFLLLESVLGFILKRDTSIPVLNKAKRALEKRAEELKALLSSEYSNVDGEVYKLTRILPNGQAIVAKQRIMKKKHYIGVRIASLNPTDKNKYVIADDIFGKYHAVTKKRHIYSWISLITFILSAGAFVYMAFSFDSWLWIMLLSLGASLAAISLIFLILSFYCLGKSRRIKKWLF